MYITHPAVHISFHSDFLILLHIIPVGDFCIPTLLDCDNSAACLHLVLQCIHLPSHLPQIHRYPSNRKVQEDQPYPKTPGFLKRSMAYMQQSLQVIQQGAYLPLVKSCPKQGLCNMIKRYSTWSFPFTKKHHKIHDTENTMQSLPSTLAKCTSILCACHHENFPFRKSSMIPSHLSGSVLYIKWLPGR